MTTFSSSLLLPLVLLSLLSTAFGGRILFSNDQEQGTAHVLGSVASLFFSDDCPSQNASSSVGSSARVVSHRYGPCSLEGREFNQSELLISLLHGDVLRASSLNDLVNSTSSSSGELHALEAAIPVNLGVAYDTLNYIITLSLGSPALTQTVVFDTGSTLSWVQCQPCTVSCYPQTDPIFDPSASPTYRNLPCNSIGCSLLSNSGCSPSGTCLYAVGYLSGQETAGYLGTDDLTLTSSDVFSGFVFGCGQDQKGHFGSVAGIVGLSRSELSLSSQTSSRYGRVFSYCLPSWQSSDTGDLTFGPVSSGDISYTSMVTDSRAPSLYFLELLSISVGGQKLPVSPTVYSTAGTLIDSGAVITRLPSTAYSQLRSAFRARMTQYTLSEPMSILDTCYDFTGQRTVAIPAVAMTYAGEVTADLAFPNIMIAFDKEHVCLAFAGWEDDAMVGIIGNVQQAGKRIVYDVAESRIGFGTGTCA